jgi:hypothetical protein
MRKITIALLAGAGALFVGSANASDIYTGSEYTNSDLLQPVRLVCDDSGRCYRRGGSRVIIRDSYNYMPRERYIERRSYRDWDDGPRAGVGFRAPAWAWASATIAGRPTNIMMTVSTRPADFVRRASLLCCLLRQRLSRPFR